jgi:hypothetical protein
MEEANQERIAEERQENERQREVERQQRENERQREERRRENDQEEKNRKRKEEDLQLRIIAARAVLMVLNRGVNRHINCHDPVIRATLLFDKLCLIIDSLSAFAANANPDFPADLNKEIVEASSRVSTELDYVFQYILSPSYSPDHPFGNQVMHASESHFGKMANNNES